MNGEERRQPTPTVSKRSTPPTPPPGQAERDRKPVKDRQGCRSRIRETKKRGTSNVGLDDRPGTSRRRKGGQDSEWSHSEGKRVRQGEDAREVMRRAVGKNGGACESPSSPA